VSATEREVVVRPARGDDLPAMVSLSGAKRRAYARHQPVFWRAAAGADEAQRRFFESSLTDPSLATLVAQRDGAVVGFAIGRVVPAPPVYDPGGLACVVDDFAVEDARAWATVGAALLAAMRRVATERAAVQMVVVCGSHDEPKRAFLAARGLTSASEWYVGPASSASAASEVEGAGPTIG
jgi:hypothetical protein